MAKLPIQNPVFRAIWTADSYVSSAVFETWDFIKRASSAYGSFLYRYFRLSGPRRIIIDIIDDFATLGTIAAFLLLAYALPPFSGTGDVWNKGRAYAVTLTDSNGEVIGQRGIRQDDAIPLEDIPPHMIQAVLATEDVRFFEHFGVDVFGTFRAALRNAQNDGPVQGGSSITQQVAKNLFLSPERTIRRKVHEAFLALWIEARLSKQEILKLYLDRSYLGGGTYGVEAAAQFYFGKSIRDVTVMEAAMLAGLFKAPTAFAPHRNYDTSLARANVVLYRMLDAGFLTQGELLTAKRNPPQLVARKDVDAPDWFLDWAYQETLDTLEAYSLENEYVVEVKTTIDRKLQRASQQILNKAIETNGETFNFSQAASVTMTPDGAVRAIVGGRDYEESQFNRATDADRQTGSSFKPFVYLAALLKGYKPNQIVVDGPVSVGNWSPKNYNGKFAGRTTLMNALAHSYNSIPVKISLDVTRKFIIETTHAAGIKAELDPWPPMVLGTSEMTLLDITTGYATFASGGKRVEPYAVLEIRKPTGEVIFSRAANAPEPVQVFPEEVIADLNTMMSAVVKSGTGGRADLGYTPQGGKTGTNQGYRDAWFVGYTANNVTGVWVGNDDFTPMNEVTGGKIPAPIWKEIMDVAEAGFAPKELAGLPLEGYAAKQVQVATAPSLAIDEVPDVSDPQQPIADEGARDVLEGMFALFERKQPAAKVAVAKKKRRSTVRVAAKTVRREQALVLPKANVKRRQRVASPEGAGPQRGNFFDSLFRSQPKKKKKKPMFSF